MKNPLTRAVVFIVFSIACFVVSMFPRDIIVEKLSSFLFGFSFQLFTGGIISLFIYFRNKKLNASN